jgi:hypothetical protein
MSNINEITNYLHQSIRNKIVFCKKSIDGIDFINVGKELAILLGDNPHEASCFETMYRQVLNKTKHNDQIGTYLAIENIGILFESELKIDLRSVLNQYSKNQCLIIKTDSTIENDTLYFIDSTDGVSVNLQGLSYKQI